MQVGRNVCVTLLLKLLWKLYELRIFDDKIRKMQESQFKCHNLDTCEVWLLLYHCRSYAHLWVQYIGAHYRYYTVYESYHRLCIVIHLWYDFGSALCQNVLAMMCMKWKFAHCFEYGSKQTRKLPSPPRQTVFTQAYTHKHLATGPPLPANFFSTFSAHYFDYRNIPQSNIWAIMQFPLVAPVATWLTFCFWQ